MTQDQLDKLIVESYDKEYVRISPDRNGEVNKVKFFKCKCSESECPNTFKVQRSKIARSTGYCISCANKKEPHLGSFKRMKASTKFYGFKSMMTYEEYLTLCNMSNCHYCNKFLDRIPYSTKDKSSRSYMLDRVNNDVEYIVNNCVPCCWPCNDLKGNRFTYEQFKKLRLFMKTELNL